MSDLYWVEGLLLTVTLLFPFVLAGAIAANSLLKRYARAIQPALGGKTSRFVLGWNSFSYPRQAGWPVGLGLWLGLISCWLYVALCWANYHSIPAGTTVTGRFGFGLAVFAMPCLFLWLPLSVVDLVRSKQTGRFGAIVGICGVLLNLSSITLMWSAEQMTMDYYQHTHHIQYRLEE